MEPTFNYEKLYQFCADCMQKVGCSQEEAHLTAKNLVEADARKIYSHGTARLRRYVDHIKAGLILPGQQPEIVHETPLSAVIDGHHGVGQYIGQYAMDLTLQKAEQIGFAMVTVRNSNHFGIAGYYAEQALDKQMIGFCSTNTDSMVVPTFGKNMMLGTNPIALAFPTQLPYTLMIDMATSTVPRGRLEKYARNKTAIPYGWATDENGLTTTNPALVLQNIVNKNGGGLLPLGGEGEENGGHKGYGLALMMEILCAGLSQGAYSYETYQEHGNICHVFAALRTDLFGDPAAIAQHISQLAQDLQASSKAAGQEHIYLHGEKETYYRTEALQNGIWLDQATIISLQKVGEELGVAWID